MPLCVYKSTICEHLWVISVEYENSEDFLQDQSTATRSRSVAVSVPLTHSQSTRSLQSRQISTSLPSTRGPPLPVRNRTQTLPLLPMVRPPASPPQDKMDEYVTMIAGTTKPKPEMYSYVNEGLGPAKPPEASSKEPVVPYYNISAEFLLRAKEQTAAVSELESVKPKDNALAYEYVNEGLGPAKKSALEDDDGYFIMQPTSSKNKQKSRAYSEKLDNETKTLDSYYRQTQTATTPNSALNRVHHSQSMSYRTLGHPSQAMKSKPYTRSQSEDDVFKKSTRQRPTHQSYSGRPGDKHSYRQYIMQCYPSVFGLESMQTPSTIDEGGVADFTKEGVASNTEEETDFNEDQQEASEEGMAEVSKEGVADSTEETEVEDLTLETGEGVAGPIKEGVADHNEDGKYLHYVSEWVPKRTQSDTSKNKSKKPVTRTASNFDTLV